MVELQSSDHLGHVHRAEVAHLLSEGFGRTARRTLRRLHLVVLPPDGGSGVLCCAVRCVDGSEVGSKNSAGVTCAQVAHRLGQQVSNLGSVNMPKAITALQLDRSSLQAALWATSQAASVSILQYLP